MHLARFFAYRLVGAAAMLFAVAALVFLMTDLLPGDVATRILGRNPDPERLTILRERLGLDQPLPARFLDWFGGMITGDLGVSLVSGQPIMEIVSRRLANSALLGLFAFVLYIPIALVPALVQALYRDGALDHAISGLTLGVLSIPDFLLATIFLIMFASLWPVLPARSTIDGVMSGWAVLRSLALPALTIALVMGTYAMRYLRDSLVEALQTEHVRMARLNGIPEWRVLWFHALPNALIPAINITSLNLTYLFGGVVVVEQVFAFPGFGAMLVGSLMQLDVPLIQGTVVISAAAYILGNVLADLAAMALNPKLRHVV
jgi:peptide/nickel transport system permease protein